MSELTSKQQALINAYLSNGINAPLAAMSAGYSIPAPASYSIDE